MGLDWEDILTYCEELMSVQGPKCEILTGSQCGPLYTRKMG